MLLLYSGFAVPGDGLAGVDGATEVAILVGSTEAKLGEFVAKVCGLGEELERVGFVAEDGV